VEGFESSCEPLIVTGQAAESSRPRKASFYNPSSWQQHEAAFGFSMFDHFELDSVLGSRLFSRLACVALIHISQFDVLLCDLLYLPRQFPDLCAILLVGRCNMQGNRWPSVSTAA